MSTRYQEVLSKCLKEVSKFKTKSWVKIEWKSHIPLLQNEYRNTPLKQNQTAKSTKSNQNEYHKLISTDYMKTFKTGEHKLSIIIVLHHQQQHHRHHHHHHHQYHPHYHHHYHHHHRHYNKNNNNNLCLFIPFCSKRWITRNGHINTIQKIMIQIQHYICFWYLTVMKLPNLLVLAVTGTETDWPDLKA